MAYDYPLAPLPGQVSIPRYDYSGFAQAGSDIADIFVEKRKQAATNSAIQQLMGAKTPEEQQSSLAQLMSVNPTVGAVYLRQQLTPAERMAHEDRMALLGEREREFGERADAARARADAAAAVANDKARLATQKLKFSQSQLKAEASGRLATSDSQFDNFKKTAQELLDDPNLDNAVGRRYNPVTRRFAQFTDPKIQDFWNKFDSLQSMTKQAVTNLMKNEKGQTGFGRILLQEWNNFGNTIAPLHLTNSPEQMRASLKQIVDFANNSKKTTNAKFDEEFGDSSAPSDQSTPSQTVAPGLTTMAPTGLPDVPGTGAGQGGIGDARADPRYPPGASESGANQQIRAQRTQQIIGMARNMLQQGRKKDDVIRWLKSQGIDVNADR